MAPVVTASEQRAPLDGAEVEDLGEEDDEPPPRRGILPTYEETSRDCGNDVPEDAPRWEPNMHLHLIDFDPINIRYLAEVRRSWLVLFVCYFSEAIHGVYTSSWDGRVGGVKFPDGFLRRCIRATRNEASRGERFTSDELGGTRASLIHLRGPFSLSLCRSLRPLGWRTPICSVLMSRGQQREEHCASDQSSVVYRRWV